MDLMAPKDGKRSPPLPPAGCSRRRRNACLAVVLGLICIVLLLVILGLTVFKAKHPVTSVNSITVKGLDVSLDVPRMRVDLNVTLLMDLSVKNPNKAGFKYGNSSALLYYRGQLVGEAAIPAGKISPGKTTETNTTLTILADRLLSNSNIYSDVISGTLPLATNTTISGRVTVLKLFKHHLVSYTSCNLSVNVLNRMVSKSECRYRTKL